MGPRAFDKKLVRHPLNLGVCLASYLMAPARDERQAQPHECSPAPSVEYRVDTFFPDFRAASKKKKVTKTKMQRVVEIGPVICGVDNIFNSLIFFMSCTFEPVTTNVRRSRDRMIPPVIDPSPTGIFFPLT